MVEEMDSRLKRCPCCGGETVLGSLYGCRPWVTYWLPRYRAAESFFLQAEHREERGLSPGQGREYWYRTPPAPNQSYYCPTASCSSPGWTGSAPRSHNMVWYEKACAPLVRRARGDCR